jgi:hypothetical protein
LGWDLRGRVRSVVKAVLPESVFIAIATLRRYKGEFGVFPNLIQPKTFNEKVLCRILFDRRPIWTRLQDKYSVREYVKERIGEEILATLYWVTKNPSDIPFEDLPDKFVVKPTHGSGWFYLVPDKACMNRRDLIDACRSWLIRNYYYVQREWVYKHIEPRILIEQFIDDGTGLYPIRYRLHVFEGHVHVIEVCIGKPGESRCDFYGRSWNKLPAAYSTCRNIDGPVPRPKHLDEMIRSAEVLGEGLDFVRVDLYDAADKVYFGEMTTTPGGGSLRFTPDGFDRYLGGFWK